LNLTITVKFSTELWSGKEDTKFPGSVGLFCWLVSAMMQICYDAGIGNREYKLFGELDGVVRL